MISIFDRLVAEGKVEISRLTNTRLKLHTPCQWACHFCHMEGNHHSLSVQEADALEQALIEFRDKFGFSDVHYTGGEPSIHPHVVDYVRIAKRLGFTVKMTTNAQASIRRYRDLIVAGLSEFNVSIHTLDGGALAQLMAPPRSHEWGMHAIKKQLAVIDAIKDSSSVKVNTVAGEDVETVMRIADYVRVNGISWRIMDELDHPEISFATIKAVAERMGAVPTMAHIIRGSSSCSVTMTCPDGYSFKVKMIRQFRLKGMCDGCPVDASGICKEYAYGPRLEGGKESIMVRSCLYRNDRGHVLPIREYFGHEFSASLLSEM
jgi:cyclic pyranopterin phosphate synthase